MKITDIFDAVRDGTYEEFAYFYNILNNVNIENENLGLNLLHLAIVNDKNPEDKLKIIKFLIKEGIDVNFKDTKYKRNALHNFYFNVLRPMPEYMLSVTEILVESGIGINSYDIYNSVPLKYAITISKLPTKDIERIYKYLIDKGADYKNKDIFGKSCIDYAREFSWRNDFLKLIKE